MDNMINFLLDNAKQTIINTRIALSAVGIWDYSNNDTSAGTTGTTATPEPSETDTTPGFNTGSDMPPTWD